MSDAEEDYYAVLGIDQTADARTVRKAYLKLSLQYHPDKNVNSDPQAAQRQFVRIGQAYQVLSDPTQRAAYDRYRRNATRTRTGTRNQSNASSPAPPFRPDEQEFRPPEPQQYETYREAFDATMAGMSEEELHDTMGAAAMIGSIVGSIVGTRLTKSNNVLLRSVGSAVGSMVAREAATSMVQAAHEQSTKRAAIDQDRRARVARGEEVPTEPRISGKQAWKDLVDGPVKHAAAFVKHISKAKPASSQPGDNTGQHL
jgi:curved DNA-binding protein CbpA